MSGNRTSARQAEIQRKLEEKKMKEENNRRLGKLSKQWNSLYNILEEEGPVRKYPLPQTWQSNLEKLYIDAQSPEQRYNLIREYFTFVNTLDCTTLLQPAPRPRDAGAISGELTDKIGYSLKVSMFLYLTIFNIQNRDSHIQQILATKNQEGLIKLLEILECFINSLFYKVEIEGNDETEIRLLWEAGSNYIDIEELKSLINAQDDVSQEVRTQFSDLLELTELFFGKSGIKIDNVATMQASPIFQHLMKDDNKLIVLLHDLLQNKVYDEQRKNHTGTFGRPKGVGNLVEDDFIYSLIYSPIFRLTVLFSKYLKTGNLNFLKSAVPIQIKKIGDLYELLKSINTNIEARATQTNDNRKRKIADFIEFPLKTEIQQLITKYESIQQNNDGSDNLHQLSQWLVELDAVVYNSGGEFQKYLDSKRQQPGGGDKKNKELEKEIKKISRNALKILKKKELIKEKIKKIDNKLKELDNKKKELAKIYKTKKNKVLKDKIDKTIKNINKEKLNKSEKKKELKNTSNEYKKIDKELKKMDKVLKKLKIKNNKEKLKKAKK
jgi:hypothetical protein